MRQSCARLTLLVAMICSQQVWAADWPQILGPQRNGQALGEKLPDSWPNNGPKLLWKAKLGSGYAGPAVVGELVIAFHRRDNRELVEAFELASGRSHWKTDFAARYRGGIDPDKGPRCVPTVAEETVFALGAAGDLYAVDLKTGKQRWTRNLYDDYQGDEGYFGAGSAPILIGGKLLVNVGGRGAGIVALDPATGKTVWQGTDEAASYAAPTIARVMDKEQAVFITRMNALLVDPANGKTRLLIPFGKRGPTVNAATPLVIGDVLFLTASYGIGALAVRIEPKGTTKIWGNDDSLSSQYTTPVEKDGFLYGVHGREDVGAAAFRCVKLETGTVKWSREAFGVAHVISAGDKLLVVTVAGEAILAAADPEQFRPLGRFALPAGKARALPAFSQGKLLLRTTSDEGGELLCYDVAER